MYWRIAQFLPGCWVIVMCLATWTIAIYLYGWWTVPVVAVLFAAAIALATKEEKDASP